jgi:hypothetical protein
MTAAALPDDREAALRRIAAHPDDYLICRYLPPDLASALEPAERAGRFSDMAIILLAAADKHEDTRQLLIGAHRAVVALEAQRARLQGDYVRCIRKRHEMQNEIDALKCQLQAGSEVHWKPEPELGGFTLQHGARKDEKA